MTEIIDVSPQPGPHRVTLPVFDGPLDLLLHLVKINEMDIHDIAIAEITRQYLEYMDAMAALNLDVAGDFLVMAATLLNIKSRALLPTPPADAPAVEDEIDAVLSTQDLIRRLVEYREFKERAVHLRAREEANAGVFYRAEAMAEIPGVEAQLPRLEIRLLFDAFVRVSKAVRTAPQHTIVRERFTQEEKMAEVRERLATERTLNISRLFERCVCKEEVISYFLALLELARLREITIAQAGLHEDILIGPWNEVAGETASESETHVG